MNAVNSCKWIDEVMSKEFPPGVFKDNIPMVGKIAEDQIMLVKTIFPDRRQGV